MSRDEQKAPSVLGCCWAAAGGCWPRVANGATVYEGYEGYEGLED